MNEKFDATISSLTRLINTLNNTKNFYYRLQNLNLDYIDFIMPLYKQKEEFLNKLMMEYKRLTKKEYALNYSFSNYIITYNNIGILEECVKTEMHVIDLYTEIINSDILWEVLPVLALHISHLRSSGGLLLNYLDDYKKENRSIKIDYSNHPSLVN